MAEWASDERIKLIFTDPVGLKVGTTVDTPPSVETEATVEAIRQAGQRIHSAGEALDATNNGDLDLLKLLRDRVRSACKMMWEIEGAMPSREPDGWRDRTVVDPALKGHWIRRPVTGLARARARARR